MTDYDDDDEEATVACPYCRAEIHEDSVQCPRCGKYISDEDAPPRKPWWIVIGVLLGLFAAYRWIVG
jgi:DNA-directed RNA polymerase subunit RPC12/RpoP